jgi:DNA-binding MarR family transcriptional regulator
MHAAFFGLKRAYWGSLRATRKALQERGLTAARFDLLYLLWESPRFPRRQRTLTRSLGVTAPVVSRMLKALRELGLVVRVRDWIDRRGWLVSLTAEGRERMGKAVRHFVRQRGAWRHVEHALCADVPEGPKRRDAALWLMCHLEELLERLREGFGAGGSLYYPWHPDD